MQFYIWSLEHDAWWGPNQSGYVQDKSNAGIYTEQVALEIVIGANKYLPNRPNEAMVPIE